MSPTRRGFLSGSLAAAGALGVSLATGSRRSYAAPATGKRLLILGGTKFLGPEIVAAARRRGYTITLFNRGKTHPELFPDLEKLIGDRDGNLTALRGRTWDAVVDTSGFVPRLVHDSATLLADAVKLYVFISTISVYADLDHPTDESSALAHLADEKVEEGPGTYGGLKALCEHAAERAMPGRVATLRPGLIVGPNDPTDRFTYWPARIARGGEILAPGAPTDPVQFIDVRDLAEWIITLTDGNRAGLWTAVGPKERLGIGELLAACPHRGASRLTWADAKFLHDEKVSEWSDMPVWVPPIAAATAGAALPDPILSNRRAIAAGLTFRPVAVTAADTLAWWNKLPAERRATPVAGLKAERELEVLAAWHKKSHAK